MGGWVPIWKRKRRHENEFRLHTRYGKLVCELLVDVVDLTLSLRQCFEETVETD